MVQTNGIKVMKVLEAMVVSSKVMKVSFADGERTWSLSQLEQERGACTWIPHKCISYKASSIKPTQRSWKKTQQKKLPMGASSKV